MATNKITFEMNLIHDQEVLRALESFNKVLAGMGDSSKVFGDKLNAATKDLTELAKFSASASKEFKNLQTGLTDAQKAMTQGLLDETKLKRLDAMRHEIEKITEATKKLAEENTELKRQEEYARQRNQTEHADKLQQQLELSAAKQATQEKEKAGIQSQLNELEGKVPLIQRLFGREGVFAGGAFSTSNLVKQLGGAEGLTTLGISTLVAATVSKVLHDTSPEATTTAQAQIQRAQYIGAQEAMQGDVTRQVLRESGAGTYESRGDWGKMASRLGSPWQFAKDIYGGLMTPGVSFGDYLETQERARYEDIDKQLFSFISEGTQEQVKWQQDNLMNARAFGGENLTEAMKGFAANGLLPERQRLPMEMLFRLQSRLADPTKDLDYMRAQQDYGLSDITMGTIAARYQGRTKEGTNAALQAIYGVPNLTQADIGAKEALEQYYANISQQFGGAVDFSDQYGVGNLVNAANTMRVKADVGTAEQTQSMLRVHEQMNQSAQQPGSMRHALIKSRLLAMGMDPAVADQLIAMRLDEESTRQLAVKYLQTIHPGDKRFNEQRLRKDVDDAMRTANKLSFTSFAPQTVKALEAMGIDKKTGRSYLSEFQARAATGSVSEADVTSFLAENQVGFTGGAAPAEPGKQPPAGSKSRENTADTQAKAWAEHLAHIVTYSKQIANASNEIRNGIEQLNDKSAQQLADFHHRKQQEDADRAKHMHPSNTSHGGAGFH